ncbi:MULTISPECIES: tetratricopeptide repeat protein [unclassified Nonomuraea]|uniref:tetratricopeptide repeat protein n=1 Tax=unclassified Nonomuraea TaxID=2593643 RepID=UPI0013766716|nr:tetratricopeptide repeat protein [Nonomuraea sp. KC401]NBE93452.1 tetratricopeptide repeat protein [Nonomuraea sp. K271]
MTTADDPLDRARTLLQLRRPADAERELRGVLAQQPQYATAHAFLALALVLQGNAAEAVEESDEAVRLAPDHWSTHYVAAQVHHRARRPAAALAAATTALRLNPEHPPIWEQLARTHLLAGQWREAAEAARRGLAIDPEDCDLASLLAVACTVLEDAQQARAAAADAVRLDPESATAHLAYGRAELAFGDPRQAAQAFREVLRLDPGYGQARDLLVTALKQRNPLYRWLSKVRGRFRGGWRLLFLLPAIPPVILVFVVVALLHWAAWVAEAVTTLRLARGRTTQLLFEAVESRMAVLCCGLVAVGAVGLGLGIGFGSEPLGTAGAGVMALVTPAQEAAHTGSERRRLILYAWAVLLAVAIVVSAVFAVVGVALLSLYACLATVWVAAGVRGRPELL